MPYTKKYIEVVRYPHGDPDLLADTLLACREFIHIQTDTFTGFEWDYFHLL